MILKSTHFQRARLFVQSSGIPVPHHIVVDRDNLPENQDDPTGFVETEDYVELDGGRSMQQEKLAIETGSGCAISFDAWKPLRSRITVHAISKVFGG